LALAEEFEKQGNILFKYRGIIPILFVVIGIFALFYEIKYTTFFFRNNFTYDLFALGTTLFGLAIRFYTVGHSAKNTSGRNTHGQVAESVNTTGIYSIVRHPLYLGNFLMWLGVAFLTQNPWFILAFIFIYWVYYERIMFAEEQFLRGKFDSEYTSWAAKTPAFLPKLSKFIKAKLPFNLAKSIRQEKTGILLVFFAFFLFQSIENYFFSADIFTNNFWLFAFIGAVGYYIVVKGLQMLGILNN